MRADLRGICKNQATRGVIAVLRRFFYASTISIKIINSITLFQEPETVFPPPEFLNIEIMSVNILVIF